MNIQDKKDDQRQTILLVVLSVLLVFATIIFISSRISRNRRLAQAKLTNRKIKLAALIITLIVLTAVAVILYRRIFPPAPTPVPVPVPVPVVPPAPVSE